MQGNISVTNVHSTESVLGVEICAKLPAPSLARRAEAQAALQSPQPMRACSACAGDYEDPDRTAWIRDGGEVEDVGAPEVEEEEFPAES